MAESTTSTSSFSQLLALYEKRNASEKRLLFWAIPGVILFLGTVLFVEPVMIMTSDVKDRIERVERQKVAYADTKVELFNAALVDPNEKVKSEIEQAENRLRSLEKVFENELGQLVSPQAMPTLLAQLFEQAGSLKLQKMESIKPVPLFTDEGSEKRLYKHGIRITFAGGYVDTRDFLAKAETLGWKLYWHFLEYQVDEHPNATTELEVFTLSTSEAFIGVY